jgi:hypothetical protein
VLIAKELDAEFKEQLTHVLQTYKDVFAWSYEDMKRFNPEFYHHNINLAKDAIPVLQRRYCFNLNYAAKVKEEIGKLLRVGFIKPVKRATWLMAGCGSASTMETERNNHHGCVSFTVYR